MDPAAMANRSAAEDEVDGHPLRVAKLRTVAERAGRDQLPVRHRSQQLSPVQRSRPCLQSPAVEQSASAE